MNGGLETMTIARVYLVTGSSRGLGEAIALSLLAPDAAVVGIARGSSRALAARAGAGAHVEQIGCDLAQTEALDAVVGSALSRFALPRCSLVALVNNAGVLDPVGPVGTLDPTEVHRHVALNLVAPMLLANAFLRETRGIGASRRILNISSGAAHRARAGWSVYCAGKAGLDQFSRAIALEQRSTHDGAKVVSLAPGVLDTDMQATVRSHPAARFPDVAQFVEMQRAGTLRDPADAARQVTAFLHSEDFGTREVADLREMAS
jgi:NAD(P)-dependent dehydrogenase (short-subunit alcohol dehydrogenase family)